MVGSARKLKLSYRWARAFRGNLRARNSFQNVTVKAFSKIWQHLKCKSETQSKCIQNVDTFKMYHKNYIQYVTQKLYSKCNKKLYSKCNSEEKEEMVTGGLGGCSGVYRLLFLLSFLPFFFSLSWTCVFLVAMLIRTMCILASLFGLPQEEK